MSPYNVAKMMQVYNSNMHIELILPDIMFATFVYFRKTDIIFDRVDDN